jgi:hypothetical protein
MFLGTVKCNQPIYESYGEEGRIPKRGKDVKEAIAVPRKGLRK